jgi:hypothetical protein
LVIAVAAKVPLPFSVSESVKWAGNSRVPAWTSVTPVLTCFTVLRSVVTLQLLMWLPELLNALGVPLA